MVMSVCQNIRTSNVTVNGTLIIEGTTEKVLQFIIPLKSIYYRNFGFIEQIMCYEHYREFQARKTLLVDLIFAMKKISVDLFRAASYMLMLALHKDALFH